MSLTPAQRAALQFVSRPPGPPSFWYAVGTAWRSLGQTLDAAGVALEGDTAYVEKLPIPTTAVKFGGKTPSIAAASFVAPSANVIGAVTLGDGASAWYSSMLKGDRGAVEIGAMTTVGDRAVVVSSIVGKGAIIGAGSLVQGAAVGDSASVGCGSKVFKGCTIGANAILAAGSVLPPKTTVPAGEVWAGSPAKKVGTATAADAEGISRVADINAEMAKWHMEEAWKEPSLVEQEHNDYKRSFYQTAERAATLRYDPEWEPLPSLGEHLRKISIFDVRYVPK